MRKYSTFNGWKLQGRTVVYGERSNVRNEYGDKMFHISQTAPRYPSYVKVVHHYHY